MSYGQAGESGGWGRAPKARPQTKGRVSYVWCPRNYKGVDQPAGERGGNRQFATLNSGKACLILLDTFRTQIVIIGFGKGNH
jgi:hypothetical protein